MRSLRDIFSTFITALLILVGLIALLGGVMRLQMSGAFFDAQEGFENMIAYPIPASVTNLEGARRNSMQGYSAWLRFRAPSLGAAGIRLPPYEAVDCAEILHVFALPTETQKSRFNPQWQVPCAASDCVSTPLPKGWNYAVLDRGQVYFFSTVD